MAAVGKVLPACQLKQPITFWEHLFTLEHALDQTEKINKNNKNFKA